MVYLLTLSIYRSYLFVASVIGGAWLSSLIRTAHLPSPSPRLALLSVQVKDESQGTGREGLGSIAQLHIHMLSRL